MTEAPKKVVVQVTEYSNNPMAAWRAFRGMRSLEVLEPMPMDTPIYPDKVRFVATSDTHNNTDRLKFNFPPGDVLVHSGDFSDTGEIEEIEHFNNWLGTLPHPIKIVIAGNHDISFDYGLLERGGGRRFGFSSSFKDELKEEHGIDHPRDLLTNCIYVEDSEVNAAGYRVYGAPWQPWFYSWAFNEARGEKILQKWNMIPEGIDILLTHGPPNGYGDYTGDDRAGCVELINTIQQRVHPKYHIYGHIHEGYGQYKDNKGTTFMNVAMERQRGEPHNRPMVFDLPVKEGFSKTYIDASGQKNKKVPGTGSGISLQ